MEKTFVISFIALILTACTGNYQADRSYMTAEQVQYEEEQLASAIEKYNAVIDTPTASDSEKNESASSMALRNMNLGNYGQSIKYYKEALKYDETSFPALNNLAVMYEEMGDLDNAIKYLGELYNYYTDNAEVNSDFVRVLIANGQLEEASRVIEAYKKTGKGQANEGFVKSLEESIEKAKQSN